MLKKISLLFILLLFSLNAWAAEVNAVINGVISKYDGKAFTASFNQTTTLQATEMTDTASGVLLFKAPNKMFWKYQKPEPQDIISNGKTLWIYNKRDKQVMTGEAKSFFKDGKGASFLTDIKNIRTNFNISLDGTEGDNYYLKLLPIKATLDINSIYLIISLKTFDILKVSTYNAYDDENIIEFKDIRFLQNVKDSEFDFTIPKGVDVVKYGEIPN